MRTIGLLLCLSLPLSAQEKPADFQVLARKALAAFEAGDMETLAELAATRKPQPWFVAAELTHRGEHEAAEAFARAGRHDDSDRLVAWVLSQRGHRGDLERRQAMEEAYRGMTKGDPKGALALLARFEVTDDVEGIRFLRLRKDILGRMRRFKEAGELNVEVARIALALGWREAVFASLHEAGVCFMRANETERAMEHWGRLFRWAKEWNRPGHAAQARVNLAMGHRRSRRFEEAVVELEQAIGTFEEMELQEGLSRALHTLGSVYDAADEPRKALAAYERALEIQKQSGAEASAARTLNNMGVIHKKLGDYERALESYERSLRVKERLKDRRGAAITRGNIGNVYRHLGHLSRSLDWQLRALKEFEQLRDVRSVTRTLGNLAALYRRLGEYEKAIVCADRAIDLSVRVRDPKQECLALTTLGLVHYDRGHYAQALAFMDRSMASAKGINYRRGVSASLNNLGLVQKQLGNHEEARSFYRRSLKEKEAFGDRAGMANSLANIANTFEATGDLEAALVQHEAAKKIYEELGNETGAARIRGEIGVLRRRLGDPRKAIADHEAALAILRRLDDRIGVVATLRQLALDYGALGDMEQTCARLEEGLALAEELGQHREIAEILSNLAESRLAQQQNKEALDTARRAVHEVSLMAAGLGEEQAATAREEWAFLYGVGAQAAARLEDHASLSWFLESARASALLESLGGRRSLRDAAVPEELRAEEAEARGAEAHALALYRFALKGGDRKQIRERREELEEARDAVAARIDRIQRQAKAAANVLYPNADDLEAIRGRLRKDEALVLYALLPGDALALIVEPDGARTVALGPTTAIEQACRTDSLQDPAADPAALVERARELVARPLRLSEKTRRVLLSPDGVLTYMPFVMLFPARQVAYVPSGTTYGLLTRERGRTGDGVLALGDPDYGTRIDPKAVTVSRSGEALVPLPETRKEAEAVGDELLLGAEATETGFREAVGARPRWRAVHLACHGRVDAERPILSSLALASDERNDGFLTTLDVFRMQVPADLVVLSACQTARGKVYRAEGVVGLTRAFMFAGTPRVIASTWKVDDRATHALMVKFYELWKPGKTSTAAALKSAQEHVAAQAEWSHPYYWAAWQLWGLPD